MFVEPGHFYSPIPSLADIATHHRRAAAGWPQSLPGIDLRIDEQGEFLASCRAYYDEQPFPVERTGDTRYWFDNQSFGAADALALYFLLRRLEPKRIIEVGSGWSSTVMLDTSERFLACRPEITLVEPYPDQLLSLLRDGDLDRCRLLPHAVQDVPVSEFAALDANDVLFIDSTHVSRLASDVNYEIFDILPALQSGVYVHLHDIFYPFEYPLQWSDEGRGWNEAYVLRAFLEYNDEFEIVLWNDLVGYRHRAMLERDYPLWVRNPGGSFWMRRR
jgi:hypothetical protein